MAKLNKRRMQALINKAARTSGAFYLAQAALNDECRAVYGYEPGDVDAGQIIDAVLGGCGVAMGMDVSEFDDVMRQCGAVR